MKPKVFVDSQEKVDEPNIYDDRNKGTNRPATTRTLKVTSLPWVIIEHS